MVEDVAVHDEVAVESLEREVEHDFSGFALGPLPPMMPVSGVRASAGVRRPRKLSRGASLPAGRSARVVCAAERFGDGCGAPEVIALGMVDAQAAQDLDGGSVLHVLGDHLLA